MDYKFAGDFSKAPNGPFTEANKKLVWPGLSYDADKTGKHFEIVADDRFPGGRACRMTYPANSYGMKDQFYQIRIKSPQTICNLEWYWLWEDGFVFASDPAKQHGGGKLSPCINWGEVGGEESKRGTRAMIWWNCNGSNYAKPCYNPSCQDQRSGGQLIQPTKYSKPIELNKVYKFRIQEKGGPGGFAKYWITYPGETTETLLADTGTKDLMATAEDDVLYDFAFFHGGASNIYTSPHDCYARHGGVRYWSGEEYWAGEEGGNGDGGDTDEGGGTTPPTPPTGETSPFSIAVGETKIFRAAFYNVDVSPPQGIPAGTAIKWSLKPNNVSWGAEAGPNWSAIQVKGKTVGGPCTLVATDPSTGVSTEPVTVDVTETPRHDVTMGVCSVEPLPATRSETSAGKFFDEPPQ